MPAKVGVKMSQAEIDYDYSRKPQNKYKPQYTSLEIVGTTFYHICIVSFTRLLRSSQHGHGLCNIANGHGVQKGCGRGHGSCRSLYVHSTNLYPSIIQYVNLPPMQLQKDIRSLHTKPLCACLLSHADMSLNIP